MITSSTGPAWTTPEQQREDEAICACLAQLSANADGSLASPMPALDDQEGARLAASLPPVIDAHVHLFPDRMFEAIWRWFDRYGWPIRYKLHTPGVIAFLLERGVEHIVALHYAHKPGIARSMNRYMAELSKEHPQVTGMATVYPGEPESGAIVSEGFAMGLRGVKLHCHVQAFSPDSPELEAVYQTCVRHDLPLIMHAGREPKSPAYPVDPHLLCQVERVETVLRSYPGLRLCVPHLGADEFDGYLDLVERYDNLWLDTTMVVADYFTMAPPTERLSARPERILYGSDFPNIPYAWDREIMRLSDRFTDQALHQIMAQTARELFGI